MKTDVDENFFADYSDHLRQLAVNQFPDRDVEGYGMCRNGAALLLEEVADIIDRLESIGPVPKNWGTSDEFNEGWNECRELIEEIFMHGGRE